MYTKYGVVFFAFLLIPSFAMSAENSSIPKPAGPAAEYPQYYQCHEALDNVFSFFSDMQDRTTWPETRYRGPRGVEKKDMVIVAANRNQQLGVYLYEPSGSMFCILPSKPDHILKKPYVGAGENGIDMYKVTSNKSEFIVELPRGEKPIWDPIKRAFVLYSGSPSERWNMPWEQEYHSMTCNKVTDAFSAEAINAHMSLRLQRLNELLSDARAKEKLKSVTHAVVADLQLSEQKCAPLSRVYTEMKSIIARRQEWEGLKKNPELQLAQDPKTVGLNNVSN